MFFLSFGCLEFPGHRMQLLYKTTQIDGSIDIMTAREINVVFTDETNLLIYSDFFNDTETFSSVTKEFVKKKGLYEEDHVFSCATYELAHFRTLRQIVGNGNLLIIKADLVERGVRVSNELKRLEDKVEAEKFCKYIGEILQRYTAKTKTLEQLLRGLKKQVRRLQTKVKDCEENKEILKQCLVDAEEHRKAKRHRVGSVAMTNYEREVFTRKRIRDRIKFLLEELISVGDLHTLTTRLCKERIKEHFGERGDQVCFEFKTLIKQTIHTEVQKRASEE